jgi:cyclomaltodextrinase
MPGKRRSPAVLLSFVVLAPLLVLCAISSCAPVAASESVLRKVTFTFTPARPAERVFLAGTFNEWNAEATLMDRQGASYEIGLVLPMGEYQYKFVADGEWITDETAGSFNPDGFGGRNSVLVVDESFPAVELRSGDGEITTDRLGHRQDPWEVAPRADGAVGFRTRVWPGDVEEVRLAWKAAGDSPRFETMERVGGDGTFDYHEALVPHPGPFVYHIALTDGGTTFHIGPDGVRPAGESYEEFAFDVSQFPAFETPDWVKEGIIYQIFPERFANGDPGNDPDFAEPYYEGLTDLPASGILNDEYFHLVDDWYDVAGLSRSPYRSDGKPDWYSFYGGDIAGVREHLDYLDDLGITIVYFNPIFESKSSHKYDAASYTRIDPHFGTNQEFAAFVEACHERGIRVVIDLAFNHTGETFWAFIDTRERGRESPYWDWYEWKKWPLPEGQTSAGSEYYDCWWGFGQMPNLNFDLARPSDDESGVRDIADARPNWPVVEHLLSATTFWLTEMHVDGLRLDVAGDVPFWFWQLFRERVKNVKPDAYILGELWGSVPEWVSGRYYDAVMNYKYFREPVLGFVARGDMTAAEFDRALAPGRFVYPDEGVRAMMNLLGSHDTERFLTTAGGDARRLKLATLFAMTYVGAPSIYYGDEIAMEGGRDPDCRRPFLWKWKSDPARADVRAFTKRLIALRHEHPCLSYGDFKTLVAEGGVFAYLRTAENDAAVVVMNAGVDDAMVEVSLPIAPPHGMWDPIAQTSVPVAKVGDGGSFTVTLPPITGVVLFPKKSASER